MIVLDNNTNNFLMNKEHITDKLFFMLVFFFSFKIFFLNLEHSRLDNYLFE